ncbi:lipopolysaccharide kinase InaA family protein [Salinimicrobium sediminilitoris]|uniref:lipopolysaccharide kinase InaA family protein n=1 Tax=Salinimicrobium sediminilitoris TaxID=2876715 RepID=UPI001E39002E|nr:lipopolysaccharide kinase InaA family protein [Salinimicrobium sediminilitoris]MCC8361453.1 lipopolysaccharide kinase InaA family protein [Salinimicrobium sediminilitoris]
MKVIIDEAYSSYKEEIFQTLDNFENEGRKIGPGKRNVVKVVSLKEKKLNIKAFKIPNAVNKIAYRFFRKSKAERSFNYAQELLKRGINTPAPVAYAEEVTSVAFLKSFYVSEQLDYDLTFRDLNLEKKGHEEILRAFTRFTFQLHEKEIEFLDHSPGNTLIQINENVFKFYLVDLNRMNFKSLSFTERMQNFKRLTRERAIYEIMADEYAKQTGRPSSEVFDQMWHFNQSFFTKRDKKERIKKKFKQK